MQHTKCSRKYPDLPLPNSIHPSIQQSVRPCTTMTFDGLMVVYVINLTNPNSGGSQPDGDCGIDCEFACPNFGPDRREREQDQQPIRRILSKLMCGQSTIPASKVNLPSLAYIKRCNNALVTVVRRRTPPHQIPIPSNGSR